MQSKGRVVVGLSGGVDSSVAAYLLKKEGFDVFGLFMRNWVDDQCSASEDFADVARISKELDIPYYSVDLSKEYFEKVFQRTLDDFKQGLTPNPDVLCNQEIKFKIFFEKAKSFGATFLATGHYARLENQNLLKGLDRNKDQSYFLHALNYPQLENVLFPLGNLTKPMVRAIAKEAKLSTAFKKESMGICFIGKKPFRPFLQNYLAKKPGKIMTLDGKILGDHEGVSFYTIGQRKDLRIGGQGEPWFVVKKDFEKNIVFVAQGKNHPALFANNLKAHHITWTLPSFPSLPLHCQAKIRYRQEDQTCFVTQTGPDELFVTFDKPQRAITPGQSIVFYEKEHCLGGAIISA